MANFYISDLHIGCMNKYEGRTLETDQKLKENWNKVVTNADTIYILGDVGRAGTNKDNEYLASYLAALKGKKVLVKGNHDRLDDIRIKQQFTEICDYKEIIDSFEGKTYKLVLCHYPILMWNGQHKGYIHLYGHIHISEYSCFLTALDKLNECFSYQTKMGRTDCPQVKAYNVGAMLPYINYCPRTLKEIMDTDRIVFAIIASAFIRIRAYRESDEMFMGDTVFDTYEEAEVRLRKMEEENIDWEEEGENIV